MTMAEAVMCGGLGGMVIGGVVATIIVRSGMIPETCVIMLQDRLWRALSAVRLAMVATDRALMGDALEKAEGHILASGRILRKQLNDEGDRV